MEEKQFWIQKADNRKKALNVKKLLTKKFSMTEAFKEKVSV